MSILSRSLLLGGALALLMPGCAEEQEPAITPVVLAGGGDRSALERTRDPAVVSPHLNRRELTPEERAARSAELERAATRNAGGGGGGGGPRTAEEWIPSRSEPASRREAERFREALAREEQEQVDGEEDPCDQYRDLAAAGMEAARRPGDAARTPPSRQDMRRVCRGLPEAYRPCMQSSYFREHIEECREVMSRMSRDGERRMERAQEEWEQFQRGEHPSQTGARMPDEDESELEDG